MPGGVDRFRFKATKGMHLVITVSAREIIPYLPDAVPGWFQASLTLYDGEAQELQHADHFSFHPDPVLFYEVPRDGEYLAEIRDSIYRGREDFIYRITIGEQPFVTGRFPLGGRCGEQTSVELTGWNLPVTNVVQEGIGKKPGSYPFSVSKGKEISNLIPFELDTLPECLEQEPNDDPESAQKVTLPIIVNGRIDKPGDNDVFRFEGKAGSDFVAEVMARRLNSPLDSVLTLTDASGKQIAFNDDREDKGSGLNTHHADSYIRTTLPDNGTYYLHLGDAQHQGGPDFAYRLRMSAPQPDFELRVVPSSITVRGGGSVPITVYALRKDGFTNEIAVVLKVAPNGFVLNGGRIPANVDKLRLTLTAPAVVFHDPVNISIEGIATVQGQKVARPGVPAEDMMQAFLYRHLVTSQELKVEVSSKNMSRFAINLVNPGLVKIPMGGTVTVRLAVPAAFADRVDLELSEPPDGVSIQKVSSNRAGGEIILACDVAKAKLGSKGNLIIEAFPQKGNGGLGKAKATQRRSGMGSLPAIPFEIVK